VTGEVTPKGKREKARGRREKGEGRREKGEGRREKGEGRREKGEGLSHSKTVIPALLTAHPGSHRIPADSTTVPFSPIIRATRTTEPPSCGRATARVR
jgi:hypothetical protein